MAKLKSVTQIGSMGSVASKPTPTMKAHMEQMSRIKSGGSSTKEYKTITPMPKREFKELKRDNGIRPSATSGRDRDEMRANKASRAKTKW